MLSDDLTKHTLNLYSGDYAKLQELYPDVGAGPVIRKIIRKFIEQCEATPAPVIDDIPETQL